MSDYIPDMTERFPEGMRGVDMTDNFFQDEDYYSAEYFDIESEECGDDYE